MRAKQTHIDTHESRSVMIGGSQSITSHAVRDFVEKDGCLNTAFRNSDPQPARAGPRLLGFSDIGQIFGGYIRPAFDQT